MKVQADLLLLEVNEVERERVERLLLLPELQRVRARLKVLAQRDVERDNRVLRAHTFNQQSFRAQLE